MKDKKKKKKEDKEISKDEMGEVNRFEKTLKQNEKLAESLEVLKYNERIFIEGISQGSKMFWIRYNTLVEQGFTKKTSI